MEVVKRDFEKLDKGSPQLCRRLKVIMEMQELLGSTSDLFLLLLFSSPTFEKYGKNHAKTEKGWEKSQKKLCNTELNYAFIYLKFYIEKEKTQ